MTDLNSLQAPLLKEQRQEYNRLVQAADELGQQLAAVSHERDTYSSESALLHTKIKQLQTTESALETDLADRSRQILALTRELALRDDPSLADWREREVPFEEGGDDAAGVISRNLIEFRSIPELLARNQQLTKVVREVTSRLEVVEGGAAGGSLSNKDAEEAVAEATVAIQTLREKLEHKEVELEKYVRERDTFSRMLSQAGVSVPAGMDLGDSFNGVAGGSLLDVVKANLESYRAELGLDSDRLRAEADAARKELSAANGEVAKLSAERDFLNGERRKSSKQNYIVSLTDPACSPFHRAHRHTHQLERPPEGRVCRTR